MSDFLLSTDSLPTALVGWVNAPRFTNNFPFAGQVWSVGVATAAAVATYKMRGMDAAVVGLYDTWLATSTPDYAGTQYHGALAKPLRDVVVIDGWTT